MQGMSACHKLFESDWMFSATSMPWHGIGTVTPDALSAVDALKTSKLDWDTGKEPIYRFRSMNQNELKKLPNEIESAIRAIQAFNTTLEVPIDIGISRMIKTHSVTIREDLPWDHVSRVLGVVGEGYQPISNSACFNLVDRVVGGMGASYETAGSLRNGKQVFLLARCPKDLQIMDDIVRPYLLLSTAHDGSGALEVKLTIIRVVCNNTLSVAVADKSTSTVRVKHTKGNVNDSGQVVGGVISDVRKGISEKVGVAAAAGGVEGVNPLITHAEQFLNSQVSLFNRLAETDIDAVFVKNYLNCLIPEPLEGNLTRSNNRRNSIREIYFGIQPGDFDPRVNGSVQQKATRLDRDSGVGSAYRLLNAVTHYNDHCAVSRQTTDKETGEKKSEAEARFDRIMDSAETSFREIGTRLLVEGIESKGESLRGALAKYAEAKKDHASRKLMVALTN